MIRLRNQQGFTMTEAMVASAIIIFISLVTFALFVGGYQHTATSERLTTAVNLARSHLEAIRNTPFHEIPVQFPSNEDAPAAEPGLPEGRWIVSYPQGLALEPLPVQVRVQWDEENGTHEVVLDTLIANSAL